MPTRAIRTRPSHALRRRTSSRHSARSAGAGGQAEPTADHRVEALGGHGQRDHVDVRRVDRGDHRVGRDAAVERDLLADVAGERPVAAQHQHVGLDADAPQHVDRVLGGLGLELAHRVEEGHQRDVHEGHVLAALLVAHLPDGLEERQRLDVAHRAADLDDDHVGRRGARGLPDARLDLVGHVRDDLHGAAEIVAAPLPLDDRVVDRAGGDVGDAAEVLVGEALVVAQVEVGLGAVLGHVHLAVLVRAHRARVDVEVGVALLQRHLEPARLEQGAERGGGDALAEAGHHAPGHEDVAHRSIAHRHPPLVAHLRIAAGPVGEPVAGGSPCR